MGSNDNRDLSRLFDKIDEEEEADREESASKLGRELQMPAAPILDSPPEVKETKESKSTDLQGFDYDLSEELAKGDPEEIINGKPRHEWVAMAKQFQQRMQESKREASIKRDLALISEQICEFCGHKFLSKRRWGKYCPPPASCRMDAYWRRRLRREGK